MRLRSIVNLAFVGLLGFLAIGSTPTVTAATAAIKLIAGDPTTNGNFGRSISISGDTLVVGSPGGASGGAAYIFHWNGVNWGQQAKLTADDGHEGDGFGLTVSISGDTVVVGAPLNNDEAVLAGAAYVFRRNGMNWNQQAKLTANDAAAGDLFGFSVAISGDTVLIGAPEDDADSGAAYIFQWNGMSWSQQTRLTASDAEPFDHFGIAVSINGHTAAVGAFFEAEKANRSGAAYVFQLNGTTWSQQAKLTASDAGAFDDFGISIGNTGNTIVIGAFLDDGEDDDSGAAYVFQWNGSTWSEQAKLTASDAAASDIFGLSVGISGDTIVVGAPGRADTGLFSGAAYVFRRTGTSWSQQAKLTASDAGPFDQFGRAVFINGDTIVIGAPFVDDGNNDSGAVYFYDLTPAATDTDLSLIKASSPNPVAMGNDLTYTIEITNGGPANATGVTLTDILPTGVTFGSATPSQGGCNESGGIVTCNMGNLANGVTATVTVVVVPTTAGAITNIATVTGTEVDPNSIDNTHIEVTTVNPAADLSVITAGSTSPAVVDNTVIYTLEVFNNGPVNATGVTLTDSLPADVIFSSAVSSQGVCNESGGIVTCNLGDLSSGATATVTINLVPTIVGNLTNIAIVAGTEADPHLPNNVTVETATAILPPIILNTKLVADEPAADDWFGYSVSISENTIVVGAFLNDDEGEDAGAAYVYQRNAGKWTQRAQLTASDAQEDSWFGYSVSISGDAIAVGAPLDSDGGRFSGSVYIFRRNGTSWNEEAKLSASDAAAGDLFGFSVSINGDAFITGAPEDDIDSGSAYIFRVNGTDWNQEAKLKAGDSAPFHEFGNSVSISGDSVVVGSFFDGHSGTRSGSAYIFQRNETNWNQVVKLTAADAGPFDEFGRSVSISNDTVAIGAVLDDEKGSDAGSVYVFQRSGQSWNQQAKLTASDATPSDLFGHFVSISADTIAVGAPGDRDTGRLAGSAYIFQRSGTIWSQQSKLFSFDSAIGDEFGISVAISNDTIVVGAFLNNHDGHNDPGAAYVLGEDPTAIELLSFTANSDTDNVNLFWETGSEVDNAGYNLHRATSASGPYTKLNGGLIAALGDPVSGASYHYIDSDIVKGLTYYYKLEDVDFYGISTFHGPVTVAASPIRRISYLPIIFK